MSSPVKIPYNSFIKIDRQSSTPVYLQITNQFSNAIQRNFLPKGTKLPGTRMMAVLLSVNRNTIVSAFEELAEQGWIEVKPNKGTFVIEKTLQKPQKIQTDPQKYQYQYPVQTGFSFIQSNLMDNPFEKTRCTYIFNDGTPDFRLSQIEQLSSFYSACLRRKHMGKKWNDTNHTDNDFFKHNLVNYLNLSRGLHIDVSNLLITRSSEMSIYLVSQILLNINDTVAVADLSYFTSNMAFQKAGARIITIPTDKQGIDVDYLEKICKKQSLRMLYITPHYHYPTTVTLSAQRRVKLLHLAAKYGFIILEDDYDYDFHYDKSPVLPLTSVDGNGMVVYIGTFGKALPSGFRTGFVVAPQNLICELQQHQTLIDRRRDTVMEQVLSELIKEGEIHRFQKKHLQVYQSRRDFFCRQLESVFGNRLTFEKPSGGLAVWMEWNTPVNLLRLKKIAEKSDLFIPKTLLYQNKSITAMRVGFGHLNEKEIEHSLSIIWKSISKL